MMARAVKAARKVKAEAKVKTQKVSKARLRIDNRL
jgi:hypothetical protein